MKINYIQLKTKEDFISIMKLYKSNWKIYMWDLFKENTCYIPGENCFISLDKAKEKKGIEIKPE